ncbi:unnamed protein product [Psylliodes chrysocephalus]|uniref:Uncharacterized protein n=1 Tax=Psylliodes chrysocephalus TaxID=3402493 RepID=A0A9P0CHD4_9CUCU|nr:unnamed protein product [Psylliodes chrysocephala]
MKLSIKEVNTEIENFTGNKSDPAFKRISSRLVHLSNRVANLKVESDEEATAQNTIKTKIIMLEADLSEKINNNSPSFNTSTVSTEQVTCPSYKSVDVYKWGVYYDGNNLFDFLEHVEMLRMKQQVFQRSCDLLKDDVLFWYLYE